MLCGILCIMVVNKEEEEMDVNNTLIEFKGEVQDGKIIYVSLFVKGEKVFANIQFSTTF